MIRNAWGDNPRLLSPALISIAAGFLLCLLGLYAIDIGSGPRTPDASNPAAAAPLLSPLAVRHALYAIVGITAGILVALRDPRRIRHAAWFLLAIALGLLLVLVLPGIPEAIVRPRNGVRAWIDLGPIDLQPTELAKIAWILVLADYLRYRDDHRTLGGLFRPALITFIPIALIMLQPDLGSALLFVPTLIAILIAAGMKLKHLALVVTIGALALPASYPLLKPYQQQRIQGMISQLKGDASRNDDINFQSSTAITLIGAGKLSGNSDAQSRALVRFSKLPERHNDMILAVVINRFGLLGAFAVLVLYVLWVGGLLATAAITTDPFGRLVCVGFASIVTTQALVNAGMVAGVLPIIGVTLPFISYGGSSMVSMWLMTGLAAAISFRRSEGLVRPTFEFTDR
jgi:cell division protein FtsW (lipid II flippase)